MATDPQESFAQKIRRISQQNGWSEDFQRFSDAQINAWQPFWDEQHQRFRSEHTPSGQEGQPWTFVEKPTESVTDPQGNEWGPWGDQVGVNVTQKKTQQAGGGSGAAGGGASTPTPVDPYASGEQLGYTGNELQDTLVGLFNQRGGIFGTGQPAAGATPRTAGKDPISGVNLSGGGIWWGEGVDKSMFDTKPKPAGGGGGGGGGNDLPNYADIGNIGAPYATQNFGAMPAPPGSTTTTQPPSGSGSTEFRSSGPLDDLMKNLFSNRKTIYT